jgi:hypothetical protein
MFGQRIIKEDSKVFLTEICLFILLVLLIELASIFLPKSFSRIFSSILVFLWLIIIIRIEISWYRRLKKLIIEEDYEERKKYARPKQPWER